MRNLLQFVVRYNYIFAFLVLEVVALVFSIRNHSYQRTGFLNSATIVTGSIYETYFNFSQYLNLGKVNEMLKEENAQWRAERQRYQSICVPNEDICDTNGNIQYVYIPVKAINFSTTRSTNYITFNRGRKDGIAKDMGVVTHKGVIGVINQVSDNYSTAMSLLHEQSQIRGKVKRLHSLGWVEWRGGNPEYAMLKDIPQHQAVEVGDTVVTSGASAIFPEDYPIGIISDIKAQPGSPFYAITIKLTGQHETLQFAYVVNNLHQKEQRDLEKQNDPKK